MWMIRSVLRKITGKTKDEVALEELKSANNKAEIFLLTLSVKKIDEKDFEATKKGCENMLAILNQRTEIMENIFHKNLEEGTRWSICEISLKNARELKQKLEGQIARLTPFSQEQETT